MNQITNTKTSDLKTHPDNPRQGDVDAIAASITENGWYGTIVAQKSTGIVLAGNHRLQAATRLGLEEVPVYWVDVDDTEARKILLADNRTNDLATYDNKILGELLAELSETDDLLGTGYTDNDLDDLLVDTPQEKELVEPTIPPPPITQPGDTIRLGEHLLYCGDTTDQTVIKKLLNGTKIDLLHADPPYGMGKEKDGIANDNLYRDALDAFQLDWWAAWKPVTADNASLYIWGNPEDLWRLWWKAGLCNDSDLTFRNEIVWDKGSGMGMGSPSHHMYPTASERCLFFMVGQQFLGSQNKDDFWEGYEPLLEWSLEQLRLVGWSKSHVDRLTNTFMAGHWFSRSQFQIISRLNYDILQRAANGEAFVVPYDDLFAEFFPNVREEGNDHLRNIAQNLRELRSTFNNEHELMTDVWDLSRVYGEDRFNHATPKPVEAMLRIIRTSTEPGDTIGVPFAGTAPELIAAQKLQRKCVMTELDAGYCDLIVKRWEDATDQTAQRP
jgi:DNA modification methylase